MRTLIIKAVIGCDKQGNFIIHGSSDETPSEMFKAIAPIWTFDPSQETVHYVEIPVTIPEYEDSPNIERQRITDYPGLEGWGSSKIDSD